MPATHRLLNGSPQDPVSSTWSVSYGLADCKTEMAAVCDNRLSMPVATKKPPKAEEPPCFPADALVEFQNGTFAPMSRLQLGDSVRVGHVQGRQHQPSVGTVLDFVGLPSRTPHGGCIVRADKQTTPNRPRLMGS